MKKRSIGFIFLVSILFFLIIALTVSPASAQNIPLDLSAGAIKLTPGTKIRTPLSLIDVPGKKSAVGRSPGTPA